MSIREALAALTDEELRETLALARDQARCRFEVLLKLARGALAGGMFARAAPGAQSPDQATRLRTYAALLWETLPPHAEDETEPGNFVVVACVYLKLAEEQIDTHALLTLETALGLEAEERERAWALVRCAWAFVHLGAAGQLELL